MGIEITGKLHTIFEIKQVSDKFTKREFVLELMDNPKYPQAVLFQLTGDRCSHLDEFRVGDSVRLDFSLRGREWKSREGEIKFFNSLDVWKIEQHGKREARTERPANPPAGNAGQPDDDIPFASCDLGAEPSAIARVIR